MQCSGEMTATPYAAFRWACWSVFGYYLKKRNFRDTLSTHTPELVNMITTVLS